MTATAQRKTAACPIPGHPLLLTLLLCACLSGCGNCKKGSSGIDNIVWFPFEHRLAQDSPWPMWQHDASHTGRSPRSGPDSVSSIEEIDLCCFGFFGSPVVDADSNVYIGSIRSAEITNYCVALADPVAGASGIFHAIGPAGTPLAGFPFDSGRGSVLATAIECAPLLLDDGSILFGKDDGYMYRLGPGGAPVWEAASDDPFNPLSPTDDNEQMIPSPLLGPGNTVFFLSHFADVYGPGPVKDMVATLCPSIDYFKSTATPWYSKLYALDVATGGRRWVFDPEAEGYDPRVGWGSPALGADGSCIIGLMRTVLAGDHYVPTKGRVLAIGPDGRPRWVFPSEEDLDYSIWASPVISPSGDIYIGASDYGYDGSARLYSLTAEGVERWHYDFPLDENTIAATPALRSDGSIIVATQRRDTTDPVERYGAVYALDDQGVLQWRYPAAGTVPAGFYSSPLVDASDRVYIASEPFPWVSGTGLLLGLDSTGGLMFSEALGDYVHGSLALGPDGALYVPLRSPSRLLIIR